MIVSCPVSFSSLYLFLSFFWCSSPFVHFSTISKAKKKKKRRMHHTNHQQHLLPCFDCHPHSYIRMVHHLIERCLLLHMSRDQCVKALAQHASIQPLVTLTVWRELQKENKDFFQAYFCSISCRTSLNRYAKRVPALARRKQWK